MNRKPRKEYVFSGRDLIAAAKEGLEAMRAGKLGDLRTTTIELPKPAPRLDAEQIRDIRIHLGASQAVFARLLNIPARTAIAWERGERRPSGAALKLLHIARRRPEVLVE
jgi:putative transcriptional regulator